MALPDKPFCADGCSVFVSLSSLRDDDGRLSRPGARGETWLDEARNVKLSCKHHERLLL